MKKLYILLFVLSISSIATAQELPIFWNKFIGGDGSCSVTIRNSLPTSDKGILFTGITNCDNKGDMPSFGFGGLNLFIGKLDSNQQISWIKTYGGSQDDFGQKLCELPDGYVLAAMTESNDGDVTGFHGNQDIWILRFDLQGNLLWKKCYGGPWAENPMSVAVTSENGLLVLGYSTGPGGDVPGHYGNNEFWTDWWIFKTDNAGNIIWSKIFGGTDDDGFLGTILIRDTSYYIIGSSLSTDMDCLDTSWHSPQVNTERDYYVIKLDTTGNKLWSKSYGGTGYDTEMNAIVDERDSTIVIIGESESNDYMATGNHGLSDLLAIKIDLEGNVIWTHQLGTAETDRFGRICTGPGNGYLAYGSVHPGTIGATDGRIAFLDNLGNETSNKVFGSVKNENIASIHLYGSAYVVTGSSNSTNFTEGANIGHQGEGPAAFSFVSYLDYWPLSVTGAANADTKLHIIPNPSNGKIKVDMPNEKGILKIYSGTGSEVYKKRVKSNAQIEIDTEDWARGIYTVQWNGENGVVLTEKLVNN